jgi:hypothetical protein
MIAGQYHLIPVLRTLPPAGFAAGLLEPNAYTMSGFLGGAFIGGAFIGGGVMPPGIRLTYGML